MRTKVVAERWREHNTGGASPSPTEIEGDRLFVRSRKVGVNNITGRRGRIPLQANKEIRRESIKICVPPVGEDIILPLSNKRHEQTLYQRTAYHYKP